jgi:hypothetical protein
MVGALAVPARGDAVQVIFPLPVVPAIASANRCKTPLHPSPSSCYRAEPIAERHREQRFLSPERQRLGRTVQRASHNPTLRLLEFVAGRRACAPPNGDPQNGRCGKPMWICRCRDYPIRRIQNLSRAAQRHRFGFGVGLAHQFGSAVRHSIGGSEQHRVSGVDIARCHRMPLVSDQRRDRRLGITKIASKAREQVT